MSSEQLNFKKSFRYLNFLSMFYMTTALLSTLFVFKIVDIKISTITAGAILSPLWYFIADIITEVYGYKTAKNIIWSELILEFFFVCTAFIFVLLPSPEYWKFGSTYNQLFINLPRVFLGSLVGTLLGSFLNTILVSKWKVALHGKSFWLRSLGANAVSQLVLSSSSAFIDLTGLIPTIEIVKIILSVYPLKLIILSFLIVPTAVIAEILKKREQISVMDLKVNYNPFSFT